MEKDKFPYTDNFRLFGINLNEKYRFYVFILAFFGLPIGLFETSGYLLYVPNLIEVFISGTFSPSELFALFFTYSSFISLYVLSQLIITILSLYVLIKIYMHQRRTIPSGQKPILFAFHIDGEKQFALLGISLFGVIMYTFHLIQGLNSLFYTMLRLLYDGLLNNVSMPETIFNIATCSIVIIISTYILIRLHNFQKEEKNFPKIFSIVYHEKYINIVFILALIGIVASVIFYILINLAYIPVYVYYLFDNVPVSIRNEFSLYYSNYIRQSVIEIGRGITILISSILALKNIYTYKRKIRE